MQVRAHNNGRSAPTLLVGTFRKPESSVPVVRSVPPIWSAGQATGVASTVVFTYAVQLPPDMAPGRWVYSHSAQQLHSVEQNYETEFDVEECGR